MLMYREAKRAEETSLIVCLKLISAELDRVRVALRAVHNTKDKV